MNKWIEATLGTCIQKYNENPTEVNREHLFLYRLLTVMYRIKYPLRGKKYTADPDLKVYLEHKVCSALHKYARLTRIMQSSTDVVLSKNYHA